MDNLLMNAIDTLADLGERASENKRAKIEDVDGVAYVNTGSTLELLKPTPQPGSISTHTVEGAVSASRHDDKGAHDEQRVLAQVVSPWVARGLVAEKQAGVSRRRVVFDLASVANSKHVLDGFTLPVEDAIVAIRSSFAKSAERDEMLAVVANLTVTNDAVLADDGLSQVVSTKVGVVKSGKAATRERYELTPHDPFPGLDYTKCAPITAFLRVLSDGGRPLVRLVVVGDGVWQAQAEEVLRAALAYEGFSVA